jgi:hypothetical protein
VIQRQCFKRLACKLVAHTAIAARARTQFPCVRDDEISHSLAMVCVRPDVAADRKLCARQNSVVLAKKRAQHVDLSQHREDAWIGLKVKILDGSGCHYG